MLEQLCKGDVFHSTQGHKYRTFQKQSCVSLAKMSRIGEVSSGQNASWIAAMNNFCFSQLHSIPQHNIRCWLG